MKVYTNNNFRGLWPVPTAAVIVASTKKQAFAMLMEEFERRVGDYSDEEKAEIFESLNELDTTTKQVEILSIGDY